MTEDWLRWSRALQSIAQMGGHYTDNPYDRERYGQIRAIAAEILARHTTATPDAARALFSEQIGPATPRVDVRGVVIREGRILLVREVLDHGRWTVPGGWADPNETPSEACVREVFEESGYRTRAVKLLAALDRDAQGHTPPFPFQIYKLFFACEITGGAPATSLETSEVGFFGEDEIPELSSGRITRAQIHRFFIHARDPTLPSEFD